MGDAWIIWGGQHRPRVLMGGGGSVREAGVQGAEARVLRGLCRRWSESGTDPPPHAEASGGASPAHTTGSTRPRAPTAEGDISGSEATGFVIMWYSVPVHCLCEIYSFIFIILGILWYL